jgi:hypothetical protein
MPRDWVLLGETVRSWHGRRFECMPRLRDGNHDVRILASPKLSKRSASSLFTVEKKLSKMKMMRA